MAVFYGIGIRLAAGIYKVASWAFELFLILANGQIIDGSAYEQMISNVYVIIGIVLLFVMAFSFLKSMVDTEDKKTTQNTKKIIINIVTSGILMALLPTIFTFAYDVQNSILTYNTIGRFFGYGTVTINPDDPQDTLTKLDQVKLQANSITDGIFTAFLNVNPEYCEDTESLINCQQSIIAKDDVADVLSNQSFQDTSNFVKQTGEFEYYDAFAQNAADGELSFNFLLSVIAGAILIYVAVSFCFDMAVRLVKLVFYQLIAPIPIFTRIIPEGKLSGIFKQWLKVTSTCYLEVYIRIAVFYFCVYICNSFLNANMFSKFEEYNWQLSLFGKAFVLMGIIMFMKQAPKLFSEITGIDSGKMKLGIKDKLKDGGAFAAGAVVGGGVTALTRNATNAWMSTHEKDANNKWKRKEGVSKSQVARKMLTSGFAGGVSGAARSGKAGISAKNFNDMKKAAGAGAKGATDARNRREAYRVQHTGENIMMARAVDKWADVKAWAGGGFEAEEAQLKAYNEFLSASDKAKSDTEKVMAKYGTNSKIVKMLEAKKYKGVEESMAQQFNSLFAGTDLSTMENTINAMKNQKIEKKSVEKFVGLTSYEQETLDDIQERIRTAKTEEERTRAQNMYNEFRERYKDKIQNVMQTDEEYANELRNHNARVAAYEAMYQQVRKETVKNIQSLSFINLENNPKAQEYIDNIGININDLSAIKADIETTQNQLNAMGRGQELKVEFTPVTDAAGNILSHTGAGDSLKDVSDTIELERNQKSAEVARKKAERDSRQQNSGK